MFRNTLTCLKLASRILTPARTLVPRAAPLASYAFATNNKDPQSTLAKKLEEEIKYEQENAPDNSECHDIIRKKGWTVNTQGTLVELTKQVDDATVHIVFYARSPQPEQPEPEQKGQEQQQQEDEQMPDYCEFTVYVKRPTLNDYLYADFVTSQGEVTLGSVNFTNDYLSHRSLNKFDRSPNTYQGPDVETIDESLIENIHNYFDRLGVDEELVTVIEEYSVNVEHPHYVKWLSDLKTFLK